MFGTIIDWKFHQRIPASSMLSDYNYEKSFNKNKKIEDVFNNSSDEALEAKRGVEKYVLDKNEIAGYPIYKDSRLDSWLVPIFDKKTKKFKGSVYIYNGGEAFVLGPQSYLEYKNIVNGGKSHKSDLSNGVKNSHSKWDVLNSSKIIRNVVVEGKLNKYFSNSNNVYSRVDVDLNEYSNLDFDSYPSINESS